MNVLKLSNGKYIVEAENGETFEGKPWYEKKTDKWYIHLPKDNSTGREYITKKLVDDSPNKEYKFETKTSGPRSLSGGGWRSRLTKDELKTLEEAEKTIKSLKEVGLNRKPVKTDLTTQEGIEAEIEKLRARLKMMRGE